MSEWEINQEPKTRQYFFKSVEDAETAFFCTEEAGDRLIKLIDDFEQLQNKLAESEARVGRLAEAANCINHWHDSGPDGMVVSSDHVRNLWQVLNETKSQSLQHIQAGAIEKAAEECSGLLAFEVVCRKQGLLDYAKQLRQQQANGE